MTALQKISRTLFPFLWKQKGKTNFCFLMLLAKLKTLYPKILYLELLINFSCNESYYDKSIRHSDIRSRKNISVSPLTEKKVKPISISAAYDHLLHCNYLYTFFDNFSILAQENKKFFL